MSQTPSSFRVINQRLVESLARDLDLPLNESVSTETEVTAAKLVGGRWTRSRTSEPLRSNDPRLLPMIVEALRNSGQLSIHRPDAPEQFWRGDHSGWYVYEEAIATPVTLPLAAKMPKGVTGPDALNVWVSDPPEPVLPRSDWDFTTSFLFLVEELGEFRWPIPWFMSGISSLRLVAEVLTDHRELTLKSMFDLRNSADRFGRWQPDHPIERLREIGGVVGASRRITTVYKIAYMTDEQSYPYQGEEVRVSDILAYPLYIAD